MNSYELLLNQIDVFIRKYYKNQLLKGLFLVLLVLLISFLLVTVLEYFGRFNSLIRATLFFTFISVNTFIIYTYLLIPLFKLFSFGKRISRKQAAVIIGDFFPQISDRLLNTIQLNDTLAIEGGNYELIKASINQRSQNISAIPFVNGIDLKKNFVYFKYLGPVFLVFIAIAIFSPAIITQGSKRVVNYSKEFKMEAPFDFIPINFQNTVAEGEDVRIEVKTIGDILPEKVYLVSSTGKYLMHKISRVLNVCSIPRISKNLDFHFEANGFTSNTYHMEMLPKSAIGTFDAFLHYPTYLGKKDDLVQNAGDLEVPEGTLITWKVKSKNTELITMDWKDDRDYFKEMDFQLSKRFTHSKNLTVLLKNPRLRKIDSLNYAIRVVKDGHPAIQVREQKDTVSDAIRFFDGLISDDYGLRKLQFVYTIYSTEGKPITKKVDVFNPGGTEMQFSHVVDFRRENLNLNDRIEYYFEVSDNDGVNGSKTTKSEVFNYKLPSLSALNEIRDQKQENVRENLSKLFDKAKKFEKDVDRLKKDLMNEKTSEWNKINQVQQLKAQQKAIENELQSTQQQLQESLDEKNQLSELDKELLEKQELIQDLLDKVMDDELKELLNKLEELLKTDDKEQLDKKMDKLESKSEDMQKQLDRSIEMLKKMQLNEKIDDIENELKSLSEEQEKLKVKEQEEKISDKKAAEKQEEINKKFDQLKEDMKEMEKLNESLSDPMNLGDNEEEKKSISEELNDAKDNLNKGSQKKATSNQQKASNQMQKLAKELDKKQEASNKEDQGEDMNKTRALLENLMSISFRQEDILLEFDKVSLTDPYYRKLGRLQRTLMDEMKMVEDSLSFLAKRQPKIASFVDKELRDIKSSFDQAIEAVDEHQKRDISTNLQFAMTGINNLALMLNESLQQMQQDMKGSGEGNGSCPNPKPGSKGSSGMDAKSMKEMLKKQLEKLEKGQKEGGKKPGDKPGNGLEGLGGKEVARMAAQQSQLRQKLEQLRKEMNKDGKGSGNQLNPLIKSLEQQEKDLVNRNKNADLIKRQKDILTRLLENEESLRERGFDEKRESKSGKNYNSGNLKSINQYNQQKVKQVELLRSLEPEYRKYYKDKASSYFNEVL